MRGSLSRIQKRLAALQNMLASFWKLLHFASLSSVYCRWIRSTKRSLRRFYLTYKEKKERAMARGANRLLDVFNTLQHNDRTPSFFLGSDRWKPIPNSCTLTSTLYTHSDMWGQGPYPNLWGFTLPCSMHEYANAYHCWHVLSTEFCCFLTTPALEAYGVLLGQ